MAVIMRMPRLLDGAMKEKARLHPVRASAQMNLTPLSTVSLTLPPNAPGLSARDFVEVYAQERSLGIFRVASVRTTYGDQVEATLEEAICTLEDDLTGAETKLNGNMREALETLLSFQTGRRWRLGTVESDTPFTDVEAARANVLEAVLQVTAADDTVYIDRDYGQYPWVLNVRKKPENVACECRLNRNLNGVTATLDDSSLCTRVTIDQGEGDPIIIDAETIDTWGVVNRTITIDEGQDAETEARKYINAHQNPALSVELDALALAELTGEPWDSFALGLQCAVALPQFGTVMRERVVSMNYPDLYGDPQHVRLTLSSQLSDASSTLAGLSSATNRNGSGIGKLYKYYHEVGEEAQIIAERITLMAEQIALRATKEELEEIDGVLTDKIGQVALDLDAANAQIRLKANQEYVDQKFSATELLIDGANARIDANALQIDEANKQITAAGLAIDGANAQIDLVASRTDQLEGSVSSVELLLDGLKNEITLKADKIDLQGYVTAEELAAEIAKFEYSWAQELDTNALVAGTVNGNSASFDDLGTDTARIGELTVGGSSLTKHSTSLVTGVSINLSRANVQGIPVVENATLDVSSVSLSYWGY